jgi:regulator of sigma E protease
MELIEIVLITLLTLGVLVAIHEFGHFWVARRCGVKVLRFSIGFGRALWKRQGDDGTEYVIAAIPLGGYVKMLDEREGPVAPDELPRSFNRQSLGKRAAIVLAGPVANIALAVLAYYALHLVGVRGIAPIIDRVEPGSVAEAAGLETGQEIVAVDTVPTPTRQAVSMQLLQRLGDSGTIRFDVRYGDRGSDLVYSSEARVENWLHDQEEPDLVAALGFHYVMPKVEAKIAQVIDGSPAARAGMRTGDRILTVDGAPVADWNAWVETVRAQPESTLAVEVERDGAHVALQLTPERITLEDGREVGQVGVTVEEPSWPKEYIRTKRYGPLAAWRPALTQTWELAAFTVAAAKKMIAGQISSKNLSGPITIAKVAAASARSGLEAYISFLALLSISLGVLNLFPIPVLDGGHLMYLLVEAVKGSPVSERAQMVGYQIGLVILIGVMMLAFYNDIQRLAAN